MANIEIKIPLEDLRKRKLFLATPMYGGQNAGMFARSVADLCALCTHHSIQLQMYYLFNESLITRARNYCCDEFMRSDATHLLFIDSDIGFNPQDVLAMLALQGEETQYDVLCGPYPKKCISWEKVKAAVDKGYADDNPNELEKFVGDYVFNPKMGSTSIPIHQPVEVMEGGTGFMMIRKSSMQKWADAFPEMAYRPDHVRTEHFDGSRKIMAFFDCVIDRGYSFGEIRRLVEKLSKLNADEYTDLGNVIEEAQVLLKKEETASLRYLSEDYKFCYDMDKIGLKVWLCPWIKLQHVGTYVFGGSLADLAALGVSATADAEVLEKFKKKPLKK